MKTTGKLKFTHYERRKTQPSLTVKSDSFILFQGEQIPCSIHGGKNKKFQVGQ